MGKLNAYVELESGLEHDLLRVLDRDPRTTWIVAQPFQLTFPDPKRRTGRRHTPDLLSADLEGGVTVWDVKNPLAAESETFALVSERTAHACRARGWHYKVFTGLEPVHRHNLLWLHAYRRRPPWTGECEAEVVSASVGGTSLGALMKVARGEEAVAAIWHLIWTGRLDIDLSQRLTDSSAVTAHE